jgi:hypothetical protein
MIKTPIFYLDSENPNEKNKFALFEQFGIILLPYISLYFTSNEIDKLVNYCHSDELQEAINYIKRLIHFHGFYKIFQSDGDFRNLLTFIAGNYDKKFEENHLNTTLIKTNFEISKSIIFNTMDILTNKGKNKFNDRDFFIFRKACAWIVKILNLEEKNKFFNYFEIKENTFYEFTFVSNYISDVILSKCKKSNQKRKAYNYNDNNVLKSEIFKEICDRDKKLIEPIIKYLDENVKCVDIETFNKLPSFGFNENNIDEKNQKQNYNDLKKQLKLTKPKDRYGAYVLDILNRSFILVWNCYLISTLTLLNSIGEFNKFLNDFDFIQYVKNDKLSKKENIDKIRNLLVFNLYNKDFKKIIEILKEKYPKKYEFLGLSNLIIQPYIIFNDIIKIITDEIKNNKIAKLFKIKDNDNKNIITFILDKENYENEKLEEIIKENVKESSKYFILVINNNIRSLDQKKEIIDNKIERIDKYPINLIICGENYKVHSYIVCNIPEHHYEFSKFEENKFCESDIKRENSEYIIDSEFMKYCNFEYNYHMIVYEKIN